MFSMVLVGSVSFDTDPDSGSSHFFIRIRIQENYTDPDPGKLYGFHGSGSATLLMALLFENVFNFCNLLIGTYLFFRDASDRYWY